MSLQRLVALLAVVLGISACNSAPPPSPVGEWDATIRTLAGTDVPFRFQISGDASNIAGAFYDGEDQVRSVSGRLDGDQLTLQFEQYGSAVKVTWQGDRLNGVYDRGTRGAPYPFTAVRATSAAAVADAPPIDGDWRILTGRANEPAWRFVVRQKGDEISAAILRVDGDTGTLTGRYRDGRYVLSHFSGARPAVYAVTPQPDGSLSVIDGKNVLVAYRESDPRSASAPLPINPAEHTRMKNPAEPLRFSFKDLNGTLVSSTDERFRGKVVLVSITGSWCPNCHDEAPFLSALYRKYHDQGLEIVGLAYEEPAQLADPVRMRAFVKRYGLDYPVLLVGTTDQLAESLPQAENLSAFPTTFVVSRSGLVREIRAGFASRATGKLHEDVTGELTAVVERLLAERPAE
jgi:thiol-disulfide isomerase/thioredoxin